MRGKKKKAREKTKMRPRHEKKIILFVEEKKRKQGSFKTHLPELHIRMNIKNEAYLRGWKKKKC